MCTVHANAQSPCIECLALLHAVAPVVEQKRCHPDNYMIDTGYGSCVCMECGIEHIGGPFCLDAKFTYPRGHEITVRRKQPYTRTKRFRKYLMRACMSQGISSIPDATWAYLELHRPYSGPREILFWLKRSKLSNKCYDSLPIMTKHMCPHLSVPTLQHMDAEAASAVFRDIESGFPRGSKFVSYLYLLEHVLLRIGRSDMLPFLNRIQCPRRRREYEERIRHAALTSS